MEILTLLSSTCTHSLDQQAIAHPSLATRKLFYPSISSLAARHQHTAKILSHVPTSSSPNSETCTVVESLGGMDHVKPGKSYSAAIGPAADQSTVSKRNATPSVRSTAPQRTQKSVALPVNVSIDAASSSKHPPGPSISAPFSCPSVPAVLRR